MSGLYKVKLKVNGVSYELEVPAWERLIDTLRYRLGFVSVKEGCGRGECGNCVVLVNGAPRPSCLALTATLDGAEVVTLEGIAPPGKLHAVQVAMLKSGGVQCGFCTPGVIIMAKALLDRNPDPQVDEIKEWLAGVLCRCGSYYHYIKAVKLAAEYIKKGFVYFSEEEVKKKLHLRVVG